MLNLYLSTHPAKGIYTHMIDFGDGNIRILIIDNNSPFVLPVMRSFSGQKNVGLDVLLISKNRPNHFQYSRFLGKLHSTVNLDNSNIVDTIRDAVTEFKSDLVFATREWISALLYNHITELEKFVKVHPVPKSTTLQITGNKWNLNQWLQKNSYPHTKTSPIQNGWDGHYPILIKPVSGIGGKGIRMLASKAELEKILKENDKYIKGYFLQEFLEGYDIDISFFAIEGKILYYTIQRGLITGNLVYSKGIEFIKNEEFYNHVSEMVLKLNYSGIAHLDFIYSTVKENYFLVDFNSRYWSSVQGSRAMGINFPYLAAAWTYSNKVEVLDYREGHYYFSTTALKIIVRNLFSRTKYPVKLRDTQLYFLYNDPLPEFMFLLRKILRLFKRN